MAEGGLARGRRPEGGRREDPGSGLRWRLGKEGPSCLQEVGSLLSAQDCVGADSEWGGNEELGLYEFNFKCVSDV